jgi:hypothetical protein
MQRRNIFGQAVSGRGVLQNQAIKNVPECSGTFFMA